jgi:hypothetical protein
MTLPIKRNTDLIEKFNEVVKKSKVSKHKTVKIMPDLPRKKSKAQLKKQVKNQTDELAKKLNKTSVKINTPKGKKITIQANESATEPVGIPKKDFKNNFIDEEKAFIFKNGIYNKTIFKDHYNTFSSKFNINFTDAELFDIYNDLLKLSELANPKFSSVDDTYLKYKKSYTDLINKIKEFNNTYDYSSPSWKFSLLYDGSIITMKDEILNDIKNLNTQLTTITGLTDYQKTLKSIGLPVNNDNLTPLSDNITLLTKKYSDYLGDKDTIKKIYDYFIKIDTSKKCTFATYRDLYDIFNKTHKSLLDSINRDKFLNLGPFFNKYRDYMKDGANILKMFQDAKKLFDTILKAFSAAYKTKNYDIAFKKYDSFAFDKSIITDYKTLKDEPKSHAEDFVEIYEYVKIEFYKIDVDNLHNMPSDYPQYKLFNSLYLNKGNLDNNIKLAKSDLNYIVNNAHPCIDIIEYINIAWYDKYKMFLSPDFIDELNKILYINLLSKTKINVDDYKKILNSEGTAIIPSINGPAFSDLKKNLLDHIYKNKKAENYVIDTANDYLNTVPFSNGIFSTFNKKPFKYDGFTKFKNDMSAFRDFLPIHIYDKAKDLIHDYYEGLKKDGNIYYQYPPVYPNPFFSTTPTHKLFNGSKLEYYTIPAFNTTYDSAKKKWKAITSSLVPSYYSTNGTIYTLVNMPLPNSHYALPRSTGNISADTVLPTLYILPYAPITGLYNKMNTFLPSVDIGKYSNPTASAPAPAPTPTPPPSPTPAGPALPTSYVAISRQAPHLKKTMREFIESYLNDKNKVKSAFDELKAVGGDPTAMTTPELKDIIDKFIELNINVLNFAKNKYDLDNSFKFDAEETLLYYWLLYLTDTKVNIPLSNFDNTLAPDIDKMIDTTTATGSGRTVIKLNYKNYLPIPINNIHKQMRGGVRITVPLRTIINHDI